LTNPPPPNGPRPGDAPVQIVFEGIGAVSVKWCLAATSPLTGPLSKQPSVAIAGEYAGHPTQLWSIRKLWRVYL